MFISFKIRILFDTKVLRREEARAAVVSLLQKA